VAGIELHVPSRHPLLVGYHEAATPAALTLRPLGTCDRNRQRPTYRCGDPGPGPHYTIMRSRHRRQPPTSAVDVAVATDAPVLAPVTGRVARVSTYWLYGEVLDDRVAIIPFGRRDLRVIVLHVRAIRVSRGKRVVAGRTVLATVRRLPFSSEVNRYVGPRIPHVHIEVKRVGTSGRQA
jgi:murein DD-endopeptidase MepM/ murein hydrolase activator NlpD